MQRFARRSLSVVLALTLVAIATSIQAGDKPGKKIKKDQIPKVVSTQYVHTFGKARILKCYEEERDGKTYYRILSKQKNGKVTLLFNGGGVLEEMQEPIPASELPLLVIGTVARRFPRGKITACERITRGKTVLYSVFVLQLAVEYNEVYDPQGAVAK